MKHRKQQKKPIVAKEDYDFENNPQIRTNNFIKNYVNFICSSEIKDEKKLLLVFLHFVNPALSDEDLTALEGRNFAEKISIFIKGIAIPGIILENLQHGGYNGLTEELIKHLLFRRLNEGNPRLSHQESFYERLNEFTESKVSDISELKNPEIILRRILLHCKIIKEEVHTLDEMLKQFIKLFGEPVLELSDWISGLVKYYIFSRLFLWKHGSIPCKIIYKEVVRDFAFYPYFPHELAGVDRKRLYTISKSEFPDCEPSIEEKLGEKLEKIDITVEGNQLKNALNVVFEEPKQIPNQKISDNVQKFDESNSKMELMRKTFEKDLTLIKQELYGEMKKMDQEMKKMDGEMKKMSGEITHLKSVTSNHSILFFKALAVEIIYLFVHGGQKAIRKVNSKLAESINADKRKILEENLTANQYYMHVEILLSLSDDLIRERNSMVHFANIDVSEITENAEKDIEFLFSAQYLEGNPSLQAEIMFLRTVFKVFR